MERRWTREAASDLERIADYLSPLPYIMVYAVRGDAVYVVRILHGAQQWP